MKVEQRIEISADTQYRTGRTCPSAKKEMLSDL